MIWGDMRTMIRELVGDPERVGTTANRYSPKQLCDSINHAMKIYARKTECTKTVAATHAIGTNGVLDLSTLLPLESLEVLWNGKPVDKSNESFERQRDPLYRTSTGTAYKRWFVDVGNKIQLIPAVQLTPATVAYLYLQTPTKITTSTADNVELDARIPEADQEHLRLLAGAYLKKLLGDEKDTKLADSWITMFLGLMGGK